MRANFLISLLISIPLFGVHAAEKTIMSQNLDLSPKSEIPANADRTEAGKAMITVFNNKTLKYEIKVDHLKTGDALTIAHIHLGKADEGGKPVFVDFGADFKGGTAAQGTVALTEEQFQGLQDSTKSFYVNIHSKEKPKGLLRAQLK